MKRLIFTGALLFGLACSGTLLSVPNPGAGTGDGVREGELRADGDTEGTYALIRACGYNYETPDRSGAHAAASFQHIRQAWDEALGAHVFEFIIHIDTDDDRGKPQITDRQRNEIKTDGHSPASMVGQPGDELVVRWKFRLPEGMKTTAQFCHVHQIKGIDNAAGTADVGNPLITFTARTLSNGRRQLQVIWVGPTADATGNVYLARADLADFLGRWVEVEERIVCGREGSYWVTVTRLDDGRRLIDVPPKQLNMWREGATGLRPKWGIYRSFGKQGALKSELRDEILRFADFSVGKVAR
ncbi:hypothetical protein [Alistipes sp.]|uniref:hypothetical protein n=1 Tax=Alistipes sp. TaxID=1872444 RepID=UPI003AEFAF4D